MEENYHKQKATTTQLKDKERWNKYYKTNSYNYLKGSGSCI